MSNNFRLDQQERTILEITELVCQLMEEQGVDRSELGRRLGFLDWRIDELLDGRGPIDIRTISDVLTVLGYTLFFKAEKIT